MHLNDAKEVMLRTHLAALEHGVRANAIHLQSSPGVGKSDGVVQYAVDLALARNEPVGVVQFMLATVTSPDVRGFMIPVKDASGRVDTVFSTPPWMPSGINVMVVEPDGRGGARTHRSGEWKGALPAVGVLFLDEFSQAEDDVKKPAAELVYKGEVGTAKLPIGYRVVSAGNRLSDRSGVLREMMFLVNRRCLLDIDPNLPVWLEWASSQSPANRPHYLTMSFAQKNPDIVFAGKVPDGADPFCTPRTLCLMDRDLRSLRTPEQVARDTMPLDAMAREVAAGWIGKGSAAQYFTHLKYADELPDMRDIERDPMNAKMPERSDAQMVCGYMLAHNVTEKNASNVLRYINRLKVEMQVLAIRAIGTAGNAKGGDDGYRAVVNTREFVAWCAKNKDLLVASRS